MKFFETKLLLSLALVVLFLSRFSHSECNHESNDSKTSDILVGKNQNVTVCVRRLVSDALNAKKNKKKKTAQISTLFRGRILRKIKGAYIYSEVDSLISCIANLNLFESVLDGGHWTRITAGIVSHRNERKTSIIYKVNTETVESITCRNVFVVNITVRLWYTESWGDGFQVHFLEGEEACRSPSATGNCGQLTTVLGTILGLVLLLLLCSLLFYCYRRRFSTTLCIRRAGRTSGGDGPVAGTATSAMHPGAQNLTASAHNTSAVNAIHASKLLRHESVNSAYGFGEPCGGKMQHKVRHDSINSGYLSVQDGGDRAGSGGRVIVLPNVNNIEEEDKELYYSN